MRTNLIMHFNCSECGSLLNLRYEYEEKDNKKEKPSSLNSLHTDEPTGGVVRYVPAVSVDPCRHCIGKYVGPALKLAEAITGLKEVQELQEKAAKGHHQ